MHKTLRPLFAALALPAMALTLSGCQTTDNLAVGQPFGINPNIRPAIEVGDYFTVRHGEFIVLKTSTMTQPMIDIEGTEYFRIDHSIHRLITEAPRDTNFQLLEPYSTYRAAELVYVDPEIAPSYRAVP